MQDVNHDDDRLDDLLRQAVQQLTPLPPTLSATIERRLRVAVWRRRATAAVALAASVFGIWLLGHALFSPKPPTPMIVRADSTPPAPARPDVRITFPKDAHVIAVPIESDNPNVTVVMVYPTIRPTLKNRSQQ